MCTYFKENVNVLKLKEGRSETAKDGVVGYESGESEMMN